MESQKIEGLEPASGTTRKRSQNDQIASQQKENEQTATYLWYVPK